MESLWTGVRYALKIDLWVWLIILPLIKIQFYYYKTIDKNILSYRVV